MKKVLFFAILVGLTNVASAVEKCQIKSVFNLVAFGTEYVKGKNLRSNGSVASGKNIQLLNSEIDNSDCRALVSNGNVNIIDSKINGSIESLGSLSISKSLVKGQVRSPNKIMLSDSDVGILVSPKGATMSNSTREKWWTSGLTSSLDLSKFQNDLSTASKNFKKLEKTENLKVITYKDTLTISLKNPENVIVLTSTELEKIKRLEIRGDVSQTLIINVTGESISLTDNSIDITGDIEPFNIIWNFHQAKNILIKDTMDQVLGIPGKIIAPNANIKLENALVSGGIYANSIDFNSRDENVDSELREIKYINN